jgi:hypothetical protein
MKKWRIIGQNAVFEWGARVELPTKGMKVVD